MRTEKKWLEERGFDVKVVKDTIFRRLAARATDEVEIGDFFTEFAKKALSMCGLDPSSGEFTEEIEEG